MSRKMKAQSILEYVLILGIVAVALSSMQLYFKRSIQAAIKLAADDIGDQRQGADEVDPLRGIKTQRYSTMNRYTIPTGGRGNPEVPPDRSERVRTFEGGSRRTDVDRVVTTNGIAQYTTTKEE